MKLIKVIECGREEMLGRNSYMWDLKVVNNLEKDINVFVVGDYFIFCVVVKYSSSLFLC